MQLSAIAWRHPDGCPKAIGAVFLGGVVALSAVGAAALLYALGWVLGKVLVAFPGWIARL